MKTPRSKKIIKSGQNPKQNGSAIGPKAGHSASEIPEAAQCNGTALRMATRRISQLYDVILAPSGLCSMQFSILAAVARASRPTIGEISDYLIIERSSLAHNLKPLERNGLVRVIADEIDRRMRLIVLTENGRAKFSETLPLWEDAQRSFRAAFGTKSAETLRASLKILASADFVRAFQEGKKAPAPPAE